MEPVSLTYRQPLVPGVAAGRNTEELRQTPTESAGSKTGAASSMGISPEKQQGVQPSERTVEEFKPYSRSISQSTNETGDTKKSQSDIPSAGGALAKQAPQVQAEIEQLKAIEEKVKAHEAAHKAVGGTMTGPVSYSYTRGPDNRNYITGGEVPISVSPGKTPQETVSRMQQVIKAALAPADPSPQDRAVAAQAAVQQQEASQELAAATAAPTTEKSPPTAETPPAVTLEPQNQSDSLIARDSQRAYGNPAVTGKQPEMPVVADPAQVEPRSATSPLSGDVRSSLVTMNPSSITGFGAFQSVSYYA
jgi:hypothetical protein